MEAKCCYTCKWSDVAKSGYTDYVLVCVFHWMNNVVLKPEEAKSYCKCEMDNDLKSRGYKWKVEDKMTEKISIDEAIKDLIVIRDGSHQLPTTKWKASCNLGIEALEQLKREREEHVGFWADRLPGETEE